MPLKTVKKTKATSKVASKYKLLKFNLAFDEKMELTWKLLDKRFPLFADNNSAKIKLLFNEYLINHFDLENWEKNFIKAKDKNETQDQLEEIWNVYLKD
jgi:hypothetical protein